MSQRIRERAFSNRIFPYMDIIVSAFSRMMIMGFRIFLGLDIIEDSVQTQKNAKAHYHHFSCSTEIYVAVVLEMPL